MSVEDFDLAALEAACRAFVKGDVEGRNHGFAPSAPELAAECKAQQGRMIWEAHVAAHDFVIEGSDEWRQITRLRGNPPPISEAGGQRGWLIPKDEMAEARKIALPSPITEEDRERAGRILSNLRIGDPDAERGDWGDERKSA